MSNIDKQWLQQAINDYESVRDELHFGLDDYQGNILAALRIALASLEAEAVGYVDAEYAELLKSGHIESCSVYVEPGDGCITVFTAPPAPVSVPDEITFEKIAEITESQGYEYSINECICAASWWNACRAAMLQGAEHVTTAYKLPGGWVACSERMPEGMTDVHISNGHDIGQGWWDGDTWQTQHDYYSVPGDVTHWMPLPAAPQQE